jgi:hypothetical protein
MPDLTLPLTALTCVDVGRWVVFTYGSHQYRGRIKSFNDTHVFVVFHCAGEWDCYHDFTAEAVRPAYLTWEKESCLT